MSILKLLPEQVVSLNVEADELNKQYLKLLEEQKEEDISVSDRFHLGNDTIYQQKLASIRERLRTIDEYLREYELVTEYDREKVSVGTEFTVYMDFGNGDNERGTYRLIHTCVSASETRNYVSLDSKLGGAASNKRVGDHISFLTPAKKEVKGVILDILPERIVEQAKEKSLV